jgi:hypothetical protein
MHCRLLLFQLKIKNKYLTIFNIINIPSLNTVFNLDIPSIDAPFRGYSSCLISTLSTENNK